MGNNFGHIFDMTVKSSCNCYGVIPDENTFILTYDMPIFVDRNIFFKFAVLVNAAILNFKYSFLCDSKNKL